MDQEKAKQEEWYRKLIQETRLNARVALAADLLEILRDRSTPDSEKLLQIYQITKSIVSEV